MDTSDTPREPPSPPSDAKPDTPGRRRRRLIESAAVAGELTAAIIADSRHLIARSNDTIARPHMVVATLADTAPRERQALVCERCGLEIGTPGVAIMRGRNVLHVRCA